MGASLKYYQVAVEDAFKELTALVAVDRATQLEATPMDTIVVYHLAFGKCSPRAWFVHHYACSRYYSAALSVEWPSGWIPVT
jgi:hypothetical protein